MKSFIEEYGKLIVLGLIVVTLFSFILSYDEDGFLGKLQAFKPQSTLSQDNASETLANYSAIKEPVLNIDTVKLKAGITYDLLSFVTEATSNAESKDADGNLIPVTNLKNNVTITKITDPFGNELAVPNKSEGKILFSFPAYEIDVESDDYTVGYRVTYEVVDNYYNEYPVKTTKTFQFIVV